MEFSCYERWGLIQAVQDGNLPVFDIRQEIHVSTCKRPLVMEILNQT